MSASKQIYQIDRDSKLPLYELIQQNFRELILSGQLKTGDPVPSEWELSDLYRVSRLTLRRALDDLARQGWITRRHGVGTFIANPSITRIAPGKLSFTDQMRAIGRVPSSRMIDVRVVPASEEVAAFLGLRENDAVVEITRIRLADGEPILYEISCLPQARFPDLDKVSGLENGSLYELLNTRYGISVAAMDQTLVPVLLDAEEAYHLDVPAGTPAVLSEIVAFSADNRPIEYSWSVSCGEKCKFYFRFRRGENIS